MDASALFHHNITGVSLSLSLTEYISCQANDEAKLPRDLSVLTTKSTGVVLQWQPPQDQSGLSSFSVEYSQYGAAAASGAVHFIPVGVLFYSLDNLEPFTFYSVRVAAVYYDTARYYSQTVNVTTQEDGEAHIRSGCSKVPNMHACTIFHSTRPFGRLESETVPAYIL